MKRRRRGFMLLDVLTGLAIVGLLITVLVGATFARARASRKLGDQLRATRVAEAVITQVQRGADAKASTPDDAEVKVTPIDGDFGAVRWVRVEVKVGKAIALLVGPGEGGAR